MKIEDIQEVLKKYNVSSIYSFIVERNLLEEDSKRKVRGEIKYNTLIKENVEKKYGIYIWENYENNEILYIGMAGKIKQNGFIGDHTIDKRLVASRERVEINGKKKDVLTGDYLLNKMILLKLSKLKFYIIYLDVKLFPPTYVESILLYEYLVKNNRLPILNNAF